MSEQRLRDLQRTGLLTGYTYSDDRYGNKRPKGSPDWLLMATVSGQGYAASGSVHQDLGPGDIVAYAPNIPQDYRCHAEAEHWEFYWAHFDADHDWQNFLELPALCPGLVYLHIEQEELFGHIIDELHFMHQEARRPQASNFRLAKNALERALIYIDSANPQRTDAQTDQRIQYALNFMADHLDKSLSLEQIASACHTSTSRLAHLFKQEMGMSPIKFHERQRLNRAARLLVATDHSITSIAHEIGFDDPFYFSNRFRARFQKSPRQWRKEN